MEYKTGDTVCGYTLIQPCGEGAYGSVFLAEDAIGTRVAVKLIRNSGRYSDRELAGLKNYRDCNHPNLLKIRHIEIHDDAIICVMDAADDLNHGSGEYLPDTLANRLNKFKRLDGKEVSAMVEGLLAGLEELHRKGLVHRDIKPDNILWVNGRPTLADAGLIAQTGQGSLVGTPGFMSPKLLAGEGKADASDDFYALGKVIYCALTGNPVQDYPSVPQDVTISMDADLGRAYRESCKNPVRSSAEFRQLMKSQPQKQEPEQKTEQKTEPQVRTVRGTVIVEKSSPKTKWFIVLLLIALAVLAGMLFLRKDKPGMQPEAVEPNGTTHLKKTGLQDSAYAEDLQDRAQAFLNRLGWFKEDRLASLLDYRQMTAADIADRLQYSSENPRLTTDGVPKHSYKIGTDAENKLLLLFGEASYPAMDAAKLKERQDYWRGQAGSPLAVQQKMLKTDPVMQAAAIDLFIRNAVNTLLSRNRVTAEDETNLKAVISLRQELIDPEIGQLLYLNRKNNP